jgi:hypothetical protein
MTNGEYVSRTRRSSSEGDTVQHEAEKVNETIES